MQLTDITGFGHRAHDAGAPSVLALALRRHAAGLAVVLLLASILVMPRWWVLATSPHEGVRVSIAPWGASRIGYDESLYTSGVRQAYDGELPVRDAYFANHDDAAPQPTAFWSEFIGVLGRATGGPFSSLALVTTLAALAALLLLYALAFELTGSRWVALAVLPIVFAGIQVFNQADGFLTLRHGHILRAVLTMDPDRQLHAWTRYPAPIMVLAPFFGAAIALPRAVETGSRRWMAAASVALALLVYSYLYYWTAAAVAVVGLGGWLLYRRDWVALRRLGLIGGLALLASLPELAVLARNAADVPAGADARVGLDDFGFDMSLVVTLAQRVAVALPFLWALRGSGVRGQWFIALCVAPLVVGGFTGIVPQPWHYSTQVWGVFAIPALIAGAAVVLRGIQRDRMRLAGFALATLAAIGVAHAVVFQIRAAQSVDAAYAITSDEDDAFAWVRAHVGSNETVVSPSITTNLLLASLTSASEYLADGGFSKATDDELAERMLRSQAAFGYTDDAVFERLEIETTSGGFPLTDNSGSNAELERRFEDSLAFFTFSFEIEHQERFEARAEAWHARYAELLSEQNVLAAYPADYLYCGHRERFFPATESAPGTFVRVAFREGDVTIYKIVGAPDPEARAFAGCAAPLGS